MSSVGVECEWTSRPPGVFKGRDRGWRSDWGRVSVCVCVSVCFIPSPKACRRRERGKKKKSIDLQFDFSLLPLLSDGQPRWHLDVHRRARADTAQTQGLFISASQLMYVWCGSWEVFLPTGNCHCLSKRGGEKMADQKFVPAPNRHSSSRAEWMDWEAGELLHVQREQSETIIINPPWSWRSIIYLLFSLHSFFFFSFLPPPSLFHFPCRSSFDLACDDALRSFITFKALIEGVIKRC